jgi:hypothetical protein
MQMLVGSLLGAGDRSLPVVLASAPNATPRENLKASPESGFNAGSNGGMLLKKLFVNP